MEKYDDDIWLEIEEEKLLVKCSPCHCLELTLEEAKKWKEEIENWILKQEAKSEEQNIQ